MTLPVLTGQRVRLVPASRDLARAIVEGCGIEAALAPLVAGPGWPHADTADAVRPLAEHGGDHGCWLVVTGGSEVIGDVGWFGPPDADGDCEIGYGVAAPSRRLGLGREAVALLLTWVEQQPGVRRTTAEARVGNEASLRLLAGLGFTSDGTGAPPYVRMVRPVTGRSNGPG